MVTLLFSTNVDSEIKRPVHVSIEILLSEWNKIYFDIFEIHFTANFAYHQLTHADVFANCWMYKFMIDDMITDSSR